MVENDRRRLKGMGIMELYRKYRPETLKQLIGNVEVRDSIQAKIDSNELPHSLLFTGPPGCGKTTMGYIIANMLGSIIKDKNGNSDFDNSLDFRIIDTADFRGIDSVRDIRRKMPYGGAESKNVVWLLEEIHMLGTGGASNKNPAQNALLKALEFPPEHCYFILTTTEPQMLMNTIISRCTHFEMSTITEKQMRILLKRVIKKEKKKVPDTIITKIANVSEGRPRRALTILEKIIHLKPNQMKIQVKKESKFESSGFMLAQLLFKGGTWSSAVQILKALKNENPESIRRVIYSYMISVISKKPNQRAHDIMYFFRDPLYDDGMNKLWYITHGILNNFDL